MKIGSVNEFAVFITALITERDFKNEYLIHMCPAATNLLTLLEIDPIRCAFTLCQFGRTRNGYVATHFFLPSSTAESSATSGYVVFPELFDQKCTTG